MHSVLDQPTRLADWLRRDLTAWLERYRGLRLVRLLDERMAALQKQGRIGFYGACTGQEAVVVGTACALAADDWVFPALRESSLMLLRGFGLTDYLAQLFGTRRDVLKGRQMPCHQSARSVNQVSWSSCVGSQLTHAVGAGWAAKMRGANHATVAFLGDGATSTADFHAALNFAAVFKVPVVFVCQNNQYAISVPAERQTRSSTLAAKAATYGVAAVRVDGNDVLAVEEGIASARSVTVAERRPFFVECLTYRMAPHSSSDDPSRYRSASEVSLWQQRDPIDRLLRALHQHPTFNQEELADIDQTLRQRLDTAIAEVEADAPPERSSLFDDVYATLPWHLVEQRRDAEG